MEEVMENRKHQYAGNTTENAESFSEGLKGDVAATSDKSLERKKGTEPDRIKTAGYLGTENIGNECYGCNDGMTMYRNDRKWGSQRCKCFQFATQDQEVNHEHERERSLEGNSSWESIGWHVFIFNCLIA